MSEANRPPNTPPPRPWKKGDQGAYSMAVFEVEVCRDEFGRVFSSHRPQDEEDQAVLMSWPAGGQEMAAFSLLLEAARREAFFGLLIKMSQDREYLNEVSDVKIEELSRLVEAQMVRTIRNISRSVVQEAFTVAKSD